MMNGDRQRAFYEVKYKKVRLGFEENFKNHFDQNNFLWPISEKLCNCPPFSSLKFTISPIEIKFLAQILILNISLTNLAINAIFGSNYKNEKFIKNSSVIGWWC